MKTVQNTYNFRSFPTGALATLPQGVKAATKEQSASLASHPTAFTLSTAKYTVNGTSHELASAKRNSVEASFNVPSVAEVADSKMLAAIVERTVQDYVKSTYIDNSTAVGAHDWQAIEAAWLAAQEATGGFTACPCSEEDFAEAQVLLSAYLDRVAPKFAPFATKVVANRAAKRQVEACLRKYGVSETTLNNLLGRIVQTIEASTEASEGAIEALAYCAERVQAQIDSLATVESTIADM